MRALLDTNILIASSGQGEAPPDLTDFDALQVSALSWAELLKGLHTTTSLAEYKARHARLTTLRSVLGEGLPFDDRCAEAYDTILMRLVSAGSSARAHVMDRMLAATALAHGLVLVTRDRDAFAGLDDLVRIDRR
ncbi:MULTISPECIES: PIN domain-containing protein [Bacteria]|uniref:PIN domain-containing protein n=1 Tax=Bacteria TaxID=2 RepID=UPI003C7AC2DB